VPETDKALSERTGMPLDIVTAARKCGFSDEQIAAERDPERLKAVMLSSQPSIAIRYLSQQIEAPFPIEIKQRVLTTCQFTTKVLAGSGPLRNMAEREQRQIDREIMCRGISHIRKIAIIRNMIPNAKGNIISTVTIEYEKEQ